ncbi:MAG TPA: hypothetical protein DEP28_09895 [Bacteroidetes bacterium]|nr:T9SS type A sorting domain-containing protein [Ignavibacteria bacterium]HCA43549.1 hypothetical protein [Bacteroidota bacterium]
MKKLNLFICLAIFIANLNAQVPDYPLKAYFDGTHVYTYYKNSDGNIEFQKFSHPNLVDIQTFTNPFQTPNDRPYDLVTDGQFIYITGKVNDNGNFKNLVLKYDLSGLLNDFYISDLSAYNESGFSIAKYNDDVYFTGHVTDRNGINSVLINKLDMDLNPYTNENFPVYYSFNPSVSNDFGTKILVDKGHIYVAGSTDQGGANGADIFQLTLTKENTNLVADVINIENSNEYPVDFMFTQFDADTRQKNKTVMTSISETPSVKNMITHFFDVDVNFNHYMLWYNLFQGSNSFDIPAKIIEGNSNDILLTGFTKQSSEDFDFVTMKLDKLTGKPKWTPDFTTFDNNNQDDMSSSMVKNGNFVYVAGFSEASENKYELIKIDESSGQIVTNWNATYTPTFLSKYYEGKYRIKTCVAYIENKLTLVGSICHLDGSELSFGIATIDSTGSVISTYEYDVNTQPDISINNNQKNDEKIELNVFPNPFNPETKINFNLPIAGNVNLKIYDISGKEVYAYSNFMNKGMNSVNFNGGNLPSGIYFVKLTSGIYTSTQKIMLLK